MRKVSKKIDWMEGAVCSKIKDETKNPKKECSRKDFLYLISKLNRLQLQLKLTLLFRMSILTILVHSTIELTIIEYFLSLLAASTLGFQIARRIFKNSHTAIETINQNAIVPLIHSKKLPEEKEQQKRQTASCALSVISQKSEPVSEKISMPTQKKIIEFQKSQNQRFSNELLKQKVELQHKKIQSTSYFQTRLESSQDCKFMRKIQKHQIVTDYELENESTKTNMIIPFKNNPISALSEPRSLFEVVAHQEYGKKLLSPLIQRKFISLNQLNQEWKHQMIPTWILENGRFGKSYYQSRLIGQGGFGRVYEAFNILESKKYAIKKLVMKGMVKIGELMNEVFIISKFSHPNIVSYFSCWIELATIDDASLVSAALPSADLSQCQSSAHIEKEMIYVESNSGFTFQKSSKKSNKSKSNKRSHKNEVQSLVPYEIIPNQTVNLIQIYALHIQMQLCDTNLLSFMKERTEINAIQAFRIFQQIITGLNYLHENGIVHRDLKPANILLCKDTEQVKIGDFGLAALVQENNELIIREKVGTPLYMAPQIQNGIKIEKQKLDLVDVYSLGVIYYELLHLLNLATQHERYEKLFFLQTNKVVFVDKQLKEEKKMVKLLTKTINRPNIKNVLASKEMQDLKNKYKDRVM